MLGWILCALGFMFLALAASMRAGKHKDGAFWVFLLGVAVMITGLLVGDR